jgi:hypothetical protein
MAFGLRQEPAEPPSRAARWPGELIRSSGAGLDVVVTGLLWGMPSAADIMIMCETSRLVHRVRRLPTSISDNLTSQTAANRFEG